MRDDVWLVLDQVSLESVAFDGALLIGISRHVRREQKIDAVIGVEGIETGLVFRRFDTEHGSDGAHVTAQADEAAIKPPAAVRDDGEQRDEQRSENRGTGSECAEDEAED